MKYYSFTHLTCIYTIHIFIFYTIITNIVFYNIYNGAFNRIMLVSKLFGLLLYYVDNIHIPIIILLYLYVCISCIFYILLNLEYIYMKYSNHLILYEFINNIIYIINIVLLNSKYILQNPFKPHTNLKKVLCYFTDCNIPKIFCYNYKKYKNKYLNCICKLNNNTELSSKDINITNINNPCVIECSLYKNNVVVHL